MAACVLYLKETPLAERELKGLEYVVVSRILYHLGYLAGTHDFLKTISYDSVAIDTALATEKEFVREINHALRESQL